MAPKKKGQKMDLSSFLADTATGNWADEMEDIPIAPTVKDPNALKRGDPGYFESLPDRSSRYPSGPGGQGGERFGREELPLPTKPPYTAFVGNLDFETGEGDLSGYFEGIELVNAKIIRGHDDKPKGFGYVEFKTLDGLKEGLERSGGQMSGRSVRVSVAEAPKESGRGGFGGGFGGMAESADQWRRSGPLPPRSPPAKSARTFTSANRFEGAESAGPPAADRDWGAARGSRFTANAEPPAPVRRESGGAGLGGMGGFRERERQDRGPVGATAIADTPSDWRSNRPAAPPTPVAPVTLAKEAGTGPNRSRGGFVEREVVLTGAAAEETWSRGTKFTATEAPQVRPEAARKDSAPVTPRVELEQNNWRSAKPISTEPTPTSSAHGSAHASPHPSRAQLASPNPEASTPSGSKPPVAGARGPNNVAKDAKAVERSKNMEVDWHAGRAEKEAKQKADREAREQAVKARAEAAEASGSAEKPAVVPQQGNGPRGAAWNRGGKAAAGGNVPRNLPRKAPEGEWRRGPGAPAPAAAPVSTPAPAAVQPQKTKLAEPIVDEDGFTVASGHAARKQSNQQATKVLDRKDGQENKNKFSFASAGGMDELASDDDEEVDEVAKGVEKTQI